MTLLDKLKIDILKELVSFEENTNIQFDESADFSNEIISAKSLNELENIRSDLNYNACLGLLESCKNIIDYYSKLFTDTEIITKYNDELSEYVEELESVNKGTSVETYVQYKKIFDKFWTFNKKLKQNKNNFVKQNKWKFWTKIYPVWFSIVSIFYAAIITTVVGSEFIDFLFYILLGWVSLFAVLWVILRLILYPFKIPFNNN